MVLGHFGIGFGAKKFAPALSLGLLFLAVQFADLLWPDLLLLNLEKVRVQPQNNKFPLDFVYYPITHSMLMAVIWALIFGLICQMIKRDSGTSITLALCVFSHWLLDYIVHKPDLPIYFGASPKVGLGLWEYPWIAAFIEGGIFVLGAYIYFKNTKAKNSAGKWSLWLLLTLLVIGHVMGRISPPPSSAKAIGWGTNVLWLFVALGFWVDKNRISLANA